MKEPGTATLDSYNCSFLQIPEFLPGEPEEFGNPGDRFVSCLRGFDSSLRCHFGASTWAAELLAFRARFEERFGTSCGNLYNLDNVGGCVFVGCCSMHVWRPHWAGMIIFFFFVSSF